MRWNEFQDRRSEILRAPREGANILALLLVIDLLWLIVEPIEPLEEPSKEGA